MENNLKHRWNCEPLSFFMTVVRAGVNSAYSKNDVDQSINDVGRYVQCSNTKKKKYENFFTVCTLESLSISFCNKANGHHCQKSDTQW